jgi:hypothetical protein
MMLRIAAATLIAGSLVQWATADVAFLAAPRNGGKFHTQSVSESDGVHVFQREAQLVVRAAGGGERVLMSGSVLDFSVCADGRTLLVSQVGAEGADIYRVDAQTGDTQQLTDGPGWNCQAVECGNGDIAFLSDRDRWRNPGENYRGFTVYRMNADGGEVERIWHAGFGGVFGLAIGPDGRLYFSTGENQGGLRVAAGTNWGVWSINPDGGGFRPEISAFARPDGMHDVPLDWPCIASDGSLIVSHYYDTRIYGTIHRAPKHTPTPEAPTEFGSPLWIYNPPIDPVENRFGWQRRGMHSLTPWTHNGDADALFEGRNVGHVTHSAPAPGNGVFVTWTGLDGDANMNLGVYLIPDVANPTEIPEDMEVVVDEPNRHEWMGRPLASHSAIYGSARPAQPATPRAEHLPGASPFAVIGSSDVSQWNEWLINSPSATDVRLRKLSHETEAEYVRILAFNPSIANFGGPFAGFENRYPGMYAGTNYEGFITPTNERTGFYEKLIPLLKWRQRGTGWLMFGKAPRGVEYLRRADGTLDTSFKAEIPANQCWTFQVLDGKGQAIVTANTWHQGISGEDRTNCQGCHAHNIPDPVPFEETLAASSDYPRVRLESVQRVIYEEHIKDVLPEVPQRPWQLLFHPRPTAYESWRQDYDDNPAWPEWRQRLYRDWQNTGFQAAGVTFSRETVAPPFGPWADTMNPTLVVRKYAEHTAVGAFDPDSGISALEIRAEGRDVTREFVLVPNEHVLVSRAYDGPVVAQATDGGGNVTTVERTRVDAGVPVPPSLIRTRRNWPNNER